VGEDQTTVDVVVRHVDGYSLTASAVTSNPEQVLLLGTLIDPEPPYRVETQISTRLAPELVGGRHIERESDLLLAWASGETLLRWRVATLDLGDGYRLHDARVSSDAGEMRAFGLEDLAATIGVSLFGAIAAVSIYRAIRRDQWARADFDRKWEGCLASGGSPSAVYDLSDEVGLDKGGVKMSTGSKLSVKCAMPNGA
jgi:hypothetical protein